MSWGAALSHLSNGWTYAEAQRVLCEWFARGYAWATDLDTRSARLVRVTR